MAAVTRLGSGGYGTRRTGSFASKSYDDGSIVELSLRTGIVELERLKKPGIPSGTAEWLKTTLEIIEGRRGNAIPIPPERALTFSATPTQAECEALYAAQNETRAALERLLIRLDS